MLVSKGMRRAILETLKGIFQDTGKKTKAALGKNLTEVAMQEATKMNREQAKEISGALKDWNVYRNTDAKFNFQQEKSAKELLEFDKVVSWSYDKMKELDRDIRIINDIMLQGDNYTQDANALVTRTVNYLNEKIKNPDIAPSVEKAVWNLLKNEQIGESRQFLQEAFQSRDFQTRISLLNESIMEDFADVSTVKRLLDVSAYNKNKFIFEKPEGGISDYYKVVGAANAKPVYGVDAVRQYEAIRKLKPELAAETMAAKYTDIDEMADLAKIKVETYKRQRPLLSKENAEDYAGNSIAQTAKKAFGLDTNIGDAFSVLKGIEPGTGKQLKRIHDYVSNIPVLKQKIQRPFGELISMFRVIGNNVNAKDMDPNINKASQRRIRRYIDSMYGRKAESLQRISVDVDGMPREVLGDLELIRNLGLSSEEVVLANKTINILYQTRQALEHINQSNWEAAKFCLSRSYQQTPFDIDIRNDNVGYFPIKATEEYESAILKMFNEADAEHGGIGFISTEWRNQLRQKNRSARFFTLTRQVGGSMLRENDELQLEPLQELVAYLKAVENSVVNHGSNMFDQLELTHAMYENLHLDGMTKQEIGARRKLIQDLRLQYDQSQHPKRMEDSKFGKTFSKLVSFEMLLALTNPKMVFANMFQGLELSAAMHGNRLGGYLTYIKNVSKGFKQYATGLYESRKAGQGYGALEQFHLNREKASIKNRLAADYFFDHAENTINMADLSDLGASELTGTARDYVQGFSKYFNKFGDIVTYPFRVSESIARQSVIETSSDYFMQIASKINLYAKAHPEASNDELIKMFAKSLHLNALNDAVAVENILHSLNMNGDGIRTWLKSSFKNGIINEASDVLYDSLQKYTYQNIRSQMFEYDSIRQSWLKSQLKSVSPYFAFPLAFKSWGFYFGEYLRGMVNSAVNGGDKTPLAQLVIGSTLLYAGAEYSYSVLHDPKYKKGKKVDFNTWFREGLANTARYYKGRAPILSPIDLAATPMEEMLGIASPIYGAGLWTALEGMDIVSNVARLPFRGGEWASESIRKYPKQKAYELARHEVFFSKLKAMYQNGAEIGIFDEIKKKRKEKKLHSSSSLVNFIVDSIGD